MALVDYDLLTRYLASDCTSVERTRVDRWLAESPDHPALLLALREVATDTRELTPNRKAELLAAIKRQPAAVPPDRPAALNNDIEVARTPNPIPRFIFHQRVRWSTAVRVAAALAALLVAAVGGRFLVQPGRSDLPLSSNSAVRSFVTARGQRLALRLPDGTTVTLAPASLLRLPPDYGTRTRRVDLEGEAAFTVRHDATRPFTVRTSRGIIRDLGTRFVARAYPDDPTAEVAVAEGIVAFIPDTARVSRQDSIVLAPGERAQITGDGSIAVGRGIDLDSYFAWTTGRLVFRDIPLREAAARMSRWYDIDVRLASPAIGNRLLTITLDEESTADVMPLIAASLNLELTRSGRDYTFHAR